MDFLVILFFYKLYDHINIFKHIKEKYVQSEIKMSRIIQKQHAKITKIKYGTNYLLYCKRNGFIPLFARTKFAVKINKYLCDKIGRQKLDAEIRNKHCKKKRLLQQVKNNTDSLPNKIGFITKLVLYRKTKLIIKKEETNCNQKNVNLINPNFKYNQ